MDVTLRVGTSTSLPFRRRVVELSNMAGVTTIADNNDDPETRRPQFGTRNLPHDGNIFQHNAWDNVTWDEEQEKLAQQKVDENSTVTMSSEQLFKYETEADKYWDKFYGVHNNGFFKDRHWLLIEFPELAPNTVKQDTERPMRAAFTDEDKKCSEKHIKILDLPCKDNCRILEIGCGVGNTVFPILMYNTDPKLFIYCCDFSAKAINILQQNPAYNVDRCKAFVLDVTQEMWTTPFEPESLDIIVLIFVLSAIHPDKMHHVMRQMYRYLKSGGIILFRDYGRHDLAQLRFKKGNCLGENFYVRGDGTRVYFFSQEDIRKLFTDNGFVEEQNFMDRRLQVNRGKQLKMYRIWVQAKYRKS
ncbi:PREDICTED: methyltransferase-like protein 2 [Acromyrmex echinatior]|uniref:tRNA N(3)-methylcytidine methyltransferase n=1 Tax=Acromyrmex echinatior TaxID=103372 RepID=F4WJF6_ACREC|nr:PREDICTED: methyltransferase-like protein 2 [Acromyrmex echinatior]EGI65734.1 Methyltransferase-like protein 2-A [Acromyrmex echinatior]